jgi:hypothetical protein
VEHWAHFLILYYPPVNTQITGVGNRTTIADGNTWNHEHLALLGKCLVSEEEKSYKITRHLADYVLVWSTRYAGMYGDDLAKVRSTRMTSRRFAKAANRNARSLARGDRKWALNDGQIPKFRGVRVHASTGYNRAEGNRRAWRYGLVSDLPPEIPHVTIRDF